jgi:guanylate kinase
VRQRVPGAVLVFVLPPSGGELIRRLRGRRSESTESLRTRLGIAVEELGSVGEYDYVVVNDDLEQAVSAVSAILDAESAHVVRPEGLNDRIDQIRQRVAAEAGALPANQPQPGGQKA